MVALLPRLPLPWELAGPRLGSQSSGSHRPAHRPAHRTAVQQPGSPAQPPCRRPRRALDALAPCAAAQQLARRVAPQVLVVDDDPMCLKVVSAMLQRCHYEGAPGRGARSQRAVLYGRGGQHAGTAPRAAASVAAAAAASCSCSRRRLHVLTARRRRAAAAPAVETRSSGQEALQLLRERQEQHHQFDLVLSDVYMPGARGAGAAGPLPGRAAACPAASAERAPSRALAPTCAAARRASACAARPPHSAPALLGLPTRLPACRHGWVQAAGAHWPGAGPASHQ